MMRQKIQPGHAAPILAIGLAIVVQPAQLYAGQGLLEINQACAENSGCFSGDDPGFPVELVQSGSYVLTSDLEVPADTSGIELLVNADESTIDLNGFAIKGPETCDGTPVTSCSGSSQVNAVDGTFRAGVTVRNGTLSGMSRDGVTLGDRGRLENLEFHDNGEFGAWIGDDGVVEDVSSHTNGIHGVRAGDGSVLVRVRAFWNASNGIFAGSATSIAHSTARDNGQLGFSVSSGSVLNHSAAMSNEGNGVYLGADATMHDSASTVNGGYGVDCDSISGGVVRTSTISANASPYSSGCVMAGSNYCNGALGC